MTSLLAMARSGALDGALASLRGFYRDDYTKPLLFLGDGEYLAGPLPLLTAAENLRSRRGPLARTYLWWGLSLPMLNRR